MAEKIRITFLGTSDSIPSATRNHPAVLLTYQGENILVDCGEGTQRQIRKARINPCKINRILITHWHADHVLGIPGLLKTLGMLGYNKTLYIYGPRGTKELMSALLRLFDFREQYPIKIEEVSGKFFETKDFYLEAEKMTHGVPCNAYSFVKKGKIRIDKKKLKKFGIKEGKHLSRLKKGRDIIYNGKKYVAKSLTYRENEKRISFVLDTSLNDRMVSFVKNSGVFICEASFTSELEDKAKRYHHMTAAQAANVAKKAGVKKLFLIHVSQRFAKEPQKILDESKKIFRETHIPKDLDVVEV